LGAGQGFACCARLERLGCVPLYNYLPLHCTDHPRTAAHGPTGLPGAIVYPRSTEDVVRLVKIASKHAIPLIPYCAGTSLEGHTTALGYPNNPSEKQVSEKIEKGEAVVLEDLVPGLALVVDFAENMNQIISLNAQDLDAVVQPFVLRSVFFFSEKEKLTFPP
jgi:D-lactate dehydrogenase (cytochrome)